MTVNVDDTWRSATTTGQNLRSAVSTRSARLGAVSCFAEGTNPLIAEVLLCKQMAGSTPTLCLVMDLVLSVSKFSEKCYCMFLVDLGVAANTPFVSHMFTACKYQKERKRYVAFRHAWFYERESS